MTRARTHTWAVGISPLIQPLLEAVLCAFVSLAQGVAATFRMRFNRLNRDWHTDETQEALPRTKPDMQSQEPSIGFEASVQTPMLTLEACPVARVPGAGRDPVSAQSALLTRTYLSPVIPTEARQHASGMIRYMRRK